MSELELNVDQNASAFFQNTWVIYQILISQNYMFHTEIGKYVNHKLHLNFDTRLIDVLDLGCGDASQIKPIFSGLSLNHYLGCDLSKHALEMAKINLSDFALHLEFECLDMLDCIRQINQKFDVLFSSFAIHHLPSQRKSDLIKYGRKLLNPGGIFILIDVIRDFDQDRKDYLDAYLSFAHQNWTALENRHLDLIENHVREFDDPESKETYIKMGKDAGFEKIELLGKHTWHAALMLT